MTRKSHKQNKHFSLTIPPSIKALIKLKEQFKAITDKIMAIYKKEDTDNLVAGAIETFKSGFLADNYVTVSVLSTDYYTSASTDNAIAQAISTFQSGYLNDIPRTLNYLKQVAEKYPELYEFNQLLIELQPKIKAQ